MAIKMAEASRVVFSVPLGGDVSSPGPFQPGRQSNGTVNWDTEERWLRDRRPRTRQVYNEYMVRFLQQSGFKTPLEFLSWTKAQQDPVAVEEVIQSFLDIVPKASRGTPASALKTYLERNGYRQLPKDFVTHQVREATENRPHYRGLTRREILALLGYLDDDLQKLFVYIQKDTGFRARVTLDLRYHNIKEDLEAEIENQEGGDSSPRKLKDYCHVKLPPQCYTGRKRAGITFIGPNSASLLRQLVEKGVVTPNPARCEPPDPSHRKDGKCTCKRLFPWEYQTIREALRLAMNKAGLDPKLQPTHGLRKFYEDALGSVRPGMDVHLKAQLEGHGLGVKWHYTPQSPQVLLPYYKEAYQFLDLTEEAAADARVKNLIEEVKSLRDQAGRYREMEIQIEALKLQMSRTVKLYELAVKDSSTPADHQTHVQQ